MTRVSGAHNTRSVALPVLLLLLWIAFVIATGRGKAEAPLALFFASFVVLPVLLLINCWVLFVRWKTRWRVFVCGALVGASAHLLAVARKPA